ncbi:MAG: hypothetical protein N2746_01605 [Deltaproteobacteria bacterium]|nr:hypothetical protein [Deltaproteobacteria bacterium]
MNRLSNLLVLLLFIFTSYCMHDTSELDKEKDVQLLDTISLDVIRDSITIDTFEVDILDIYHDIIDVGIIDIEEDNVLMDERTDLEDLDLTFEDIVDNPDVYISDVTSDLSDVAFSDIGCTNECEQVGVKICKTINQKEYVNECKDSNSDGCLEWVSIAFCLYGCSSGACLSCQPDCKDKECGSDGCGGSCGECTNPPKNYCESDKRLVVFYSEGSCNEFKCKYNSETIVCENGCENGWCKNCTPNCFGKQCGPDGCGGTCGSCGDLQRCNANGVCECKYLSCGGACCNQGQVCHNNTCCTPNCFGKQCGPDGCGGTCGSCGDLQRCNANGVCECEYLSCGGVCCGVDEVCDNNVCCLPDCNNKECGHDGCGGSCGDCFYPEKCIGGVCQ